MNIKCIDLYRAHPGRKAFVKVISVADLGCSHLSIQPKTIGTGNIPEFKQNKIKCVKDNMGKTLRFLEMPFLKPQTHMIYFYDKEQKKFKIPFLFLLSPRSS